jgi:hypothetical protein
MPLLDQTTRELEDLRDASWQSRTGLPKRWLELNGNYLITSPIYPDSAPVTSPPTPGILFTIGYLDSPVPMVLDEGTDVYPDSRIPSNHHDHLPLAAAYFLLTEDGDHQDIDVADKFLSDFLQFIGVSNGNRKPVPASR